MSNASPRRRRVGLPTEPRPSGAPARLAAALALVLLAALPLRAEELAPVEPRALAPTLLAPTLLEPADGVTHDERWATLRAHYFADATIVPGEDLLALDAPPRAHDAAVVPIAIHALDPARRIRRVHLIVDQNPLPLAGVFTFDGRADGWRTLETRIRINQYTNVRALAELEDGSLAMVSRFVKASGGCSAPAMSDLDAALARAGRMQLLIEEATADGTLAADGASPVPGGSTGRSSSLPLASATIKISHPNNSGMQFDQVSRNYIPAFFVQHVSATIDGRALLDVETNFSLSENPVIALTFPETLGHGTLDVRAIDSKGHSYERSAPFASGS